MPNLVPLASPAISFCSHNQPASVLQQTDRKPRMKVWRVPYRVISGVFATHHVPFLSKPEPDAMSRLRR